MPVLNRAGHFFLEIENVFGLFDDWSKFTLAVIGYFVVVGVYVIGKRANRIWRRRNDKRSK